MKVGVVIPSRGLVYTRTIESILRNLKGVDDYFIKFSHDKPIPDAHNYLVKYALSKQADFIWFVEEDNLIPDGVLRKMLKKMKSGTLGVIAADYPVGDGRWSCIKKERGKILWVPFGCTLMRANIFGRLKKPWFETDKSLQITEDGYKLVDIPNKYGGHDILFGIKLRENRIEVSQLSQDVGHLRVIERGKDGQNNGFHTIEDMGPIQNYQS